MEKNNKNILTMFGNKSTINYCKLAGAHILTHIAGVIALLGNKFVFTTAISMEFSSCTGT